MFAFFIILTKFCENLKVFFSDFSMIKDISPLSSSSLPRELTGCFKSEFSNSVCFLKCIAIIYNALKSINNLMNYQLCNYYFYCFQYCKHTFLFYFFIGTLRQLFPLHRIMKSYISTLGVWYTLEKVFHHLLSQMTRQIIY